SYFSRVGAWIVNWGFPTIFAELLVREGRYEELRARVTAGDQGALDRLVALFVDQDRIDEAVSVLEVRADRGDYHAAAVLTDLLIEVGRTEDVRARAAYGDPYAREKVSELLDGLGARRSSRAL
ncbi:hypothetical protein KBX53_16400, partial [Micromonospora sp. M51]|uniref:hypothetical protein n=1 Tax=Micromonospora sp. M51 TaxID=2824889 RepID=UPI001B386756